MTFQFDDGYISFAWTRNLTRICAIVTDSGFSNNKIHFGRIVQAAVQIEAERFPVTRSCETDDSRFYEGGGQEHHRPFRRNFWRGRSGPNSVRIMQRSHESSEGAMSHTGCCATIFFGADLRAGCRLGYSFVERMKTDRLVAIVRLNHEKENTSDDRSQVA